MSTLHWTTPTAEAGLNGSEYEWLRFVAHGPAVVAWQLDTDENVAALLSMSPEPESGQHGANYMHEMLRTLDALPSSDWMGRGDTARRLAIAVKTRLSTDGLPLLVAGHELHSRSVEANTALAVGADVVALAAKLFHWGETHLWIDGPDRTWLATLIRTALDIGVYRRTLRQFDQGWGSVLDLLDARADEPVVLSYSVGDGFPNPRLLGIGEDDDETWEQQTEGERWTACLEMLRTTRPWLRLGPDTLREVTFGPAVTVYDLFAPDRDARVQRAFATFEEPAHADA